MKVRSSFVSNSSSCNFVIYKKGLHATQIEYLFHMDYFREKILEFDPESNLYFTPIVDIYDRRQWLKDYADDDINQDRVKIINEADNDECIIFSTGQNDSCPQVFLALLGIPDENVKEYGYIGDGADSISKFWVELFERDYKDEFDKMIRFARQHLNKDGKFDPIAQENRITEKQAKDIILKKVYHAFPN